MLLRTIAGLLLLSATAHDARAIEVGFEHWSFDFVSPDNRFDSGPTLASNAGANAIGMSFTSTVFSPDVPITGYSNSGCAGLCSNFYYTLAMDFRVKSPTVNLVASNSYSLKLSVDEAAFLSNANYSAWGPSLVLYYLSSNPLAEGCTSCAITVVPQSVGVFSIDFVPQFSGPTAFGLQFVTGTNVNGAASSGTAAFAESGSFSFSNFSLTGPTVSAVPGPIVGAGFPGILMAIAGFVGWRRRARR